MQGNSLKLICQVGQDLMNMAAETEGKEKWLERHTHIRLFADELYGDTEEASMLSAAMTLAASKY